MKSVRNYSEKVSVKENFVKNVYTEYLLSVDNGSSSLKADGGLELNIHSVEVVIEREEDIIGADAVLEEGEITDREVSSIYTGVGLKSGSISFAIPTALNKFDALNWCDNEAIFRVVLEEDCTELASDVMISGIYLEAEDVKGSPRLSSSIISGEVIKRKEADGSLGAAKTKRSKELKSLGLVIIFSRNRKFIDLS